MPEQDDLGGFDAANPNDIIVAAEHLDLILGRLRAADVGVRDVATSSLLQLGKIVLVDVEDAARKLLEATQHLEETAAYRHRLGPEHHEDPLSVVLQALRVWAAAEFGGWVPTLGKNRMIAGPRTAGETGWGGVGAPKAVTKDPAWQPPAARGAGPGRGVRVGVLDTGLYPQSWLAGGWVARYADLLDPSEKPLYSAGHATFLAGLVLAQAPGATVEVRQVLDVDGTRDSWTVAQAIVDIARSGVDVLNLSFTCYTADGEPPLVLAAAMDRIDPDVVVVAAAGNHAEVKRNDSDEDRRRASLPAWPAALDDVVAVGAMDRAGRSAPFSPKAPWVDLDAVGVDVVSTYLERAGATSRSAKAFHGWAQWSGTSFAAATVSGAIAAGVDPGRVSARLAWASMLATLREEAGEYDPWPRSRLRLRTW